MKLILGLILGLFLALPAKATNVVVSYENQVVTAINANQYNAQVVAVHHNDLVSNLKAGHQNVKAVVVAEPQHCSYNNVNNLVSSCGAKVVVAQGVLNQYGLSGYDQSVVACVQVRRRANQVLSRRVVSRTRVFGLLTGRNARVVKVAVQNCR